MLLSVDFFTLQVCPQKNQVNQVGKPSSVNTTLPLLHSYSQSHYLTVISWPLQSSSSASSSSFFNESIFPYNQSLSILYTTNSYSPCPQAMRAMQNISTSQRSDKKRPTVEPSNQPPTAPVPDPTSQIHSGARTSSGSSRSSTYRKTNVCRNSLSFPMLGIMIPLDLLYLANISISSLAGPTAFSNRKECHPSTHSHKTATRNTYAVVTAQCNRRRCLRCLRPPWI